MKLRHRRPTPSFVISCLALFVALGGTSFAAITYATNAGKVDGKSAYASGSSLGKVAGNLVATEASGPKKGKILGKYSTGVSQSRNFVAQAPVTDNATTAPVLIGGDPSTGNLSFQCADAAAGAGREDPQAILTYTPGSQAVNFIRQTGAGRGVSTVVQPGQTQTLTVDGNNSFSVQTLVAGFSITYQGGVRQDGQNTADATCTVLGTLTRVQG